MKTDFKKYLNKAKDFGKKGIAKGKEGYGKAKAHVDKKIHDKKQEIAIDVLQETRVKTDDKRESQLLNEASNIVEDKFETGGKINGSNKILKTIFGC